ncbi:MAG: AAA family ATPase [Candidatus Desulfofervidus auxilii]|nr:AAA family ATPase [Candidatus Desulfofervidus auxilii]
MEFIESLLKPTAYPHPVKTIKLIQTHISWIFLTGEFVYKIKKPVDFGFLDFTTLEKRRYFCEEELRLNKRLSPDIYLEVTPVVKRNGNFFFGGEGEIVDYAVKMKQLPKEACLTSLLEKGELNPAIMKEIAQFMADFYFKAERNEEIESYGLPEKIEINIKENFDQTFPYIGYTISQEVYNALKEYSFSFLKDEKERFLKRISLGWIRDGHGDFHCGNIYYYNNKIYVLDCIEFNKRFRYADVATDVAFLLMDLDFRQASSFGNYFLNTYLTQTNDFNLLGVLNFYKIYRAYVRGKISSFEIDSKEIPSKQRAEAKERAEKYFNLAYSYLSSQKPFLLATTGLLGSGKSTIANALAAKIGAIVIRSDAVRKHLLGVKPEKHLYAPFGKGVYALEMIEKVYDAIFEIASEVLRYGFSVIIDASFSKEKYREKVRNLAEKMNCPYWFLYCQCDEEIMKKRLAEREKMGKDISNGYLALFLEFKRNFEPLTDPRHIVVNTAHPIDASVQAIVDILK